MWCVHVCICFLISAALGVRGKLALLITRHSECKPKSINKSYYNKSSRPNNALLSSPWPIGRDMTLWCAATIRRDLMCIRPIISCQVSVPTCFFSCGVLCVMHNGDTYYRHLRSAYAELRYFGYSGGGRFWDAKGRLLHAKFHPIAETEHFTKIW